MSLTIENPLMLCTLNGALHLTNQMFVQKFYQLKEQSIVMVKRVNTCIIFFLFDITVHHTKNKSINIGKCSSVGELRDVEKISIRFSETNTPPHL